MPLTPVDATPAIALWTLDWAALDALRSDPDEWARRSGLVLEPYTDLVRGVVEQTLAMRSGVGATPPWVGYLVADSGGRAVGTCAFKAPPDPDGTVEIAYFTFPAYEGRGYATAMARELVRLAGAQSAVRLIVAHTLPELNPSGRLLTTLGFARSGEVHDPEDGLVWRWERSPES